MSCFIVFVVVTENENARYLLTVADKLEGFRVALTNGTGFNQSTDSGMSELSVSVIGGKFTDLLINISEFIVIIIA